MCEDLFLAMLINSLISFFHTQEERGNEPGNKAIGDSAFLSEDLLISQPCTKALSSMRKSLGARLTDQ